MLRRELSHLSTAFETDYFVVLDGILWWECLGHHLIDQRLFRSYSSTTDAYLKTI
jgi:hypothetical protein